MFPRRRKSAGKVDSATASTSNRDVSKMASGQWILLVCSLLVSGYEARSNRLDDVFYSEVRDLLNQRLPQEEQQLSNESPPTPREAPGWPRTVPQLGQVSGVSVCPQGNPVILHRGPRVWDRSSFNGTVHFQHANEGPIPVDTVLTLDKNSGTVLTAWGRNMFYLPHGITVDRDNNTWITDVALHQVLKFSSGETRPSVVLGQRFEPGGGHQHLCQPTAVAVASTGEVFIADGYCNSRVLIVSPSGQFLGQLPRPAEFLSLQVPHGLALMEHEDILCVADRENMRVTCPRAGLRGPLPPTPPLTVQSPDLGRVFAVAAAGRFLFAVNGPTSPQLLVRGFTIDPISETVLDRWGPASGFSNPHAAAVSPDGSALYIGEIGPNQIWKFDLKSQQ